MRNYNSLVGLSPELRAVLSDVGVGGLPPIRGSWFIVDPYRLTVADGGIEGSFDNIADAYTACTSGLGDGILVLSGGTGTTSQTTSYLTQSLAWSKHGITVVGVAAGNGYFGRSRIANLAVTTGALTTLSFDDTASVYTINRSSGSFIADGFEVGMMIRVDSTSNTNDGAFTVTVVAAGSLTVTETVTDETAVTAGSTTITSYNPENIVVSGSNNAFYNIHVYNGSSDAAAIGCVSVTGNRNSFVNCHFVGASHATPAAEVTANDLTLVASECTFDRCYFGTNSIIRAAANGNIVLGSGATQIGQNFFSDCYIISYSATAGKGGIKIANAATLGGFIVFDRCKFLNWNSGAQTALTTIIIGSTPNNLGLLLDRCASVGYTAVGANDDTWFTTAAASAAGTGTIANSIA
jgi:hypothetical protein